MPAELVCLGKPQPPESLILSCASSNIEGVTDLCSSFSATSPSVSSQKQSASSPARLHIRSKIYGVEAAFTKLLLCMESYIHWSPKPALPENAPPSSRISCQRSWEESTMEGKATRGSRESHLSSTRGWRRGQRACWSAGRDVHETSRVGVSARKT